MLQLPIPTRDGTFLATFSDQGLAGLTFPALRNNARRKPAPISREVQRWHRATERAVNQALAGRKASGLPPLDLSPGTAFQQSVWRALQGIPAGATRSYGEIARAVGSPRASRAVGQACGANPIPVLIPCHRALAAGGKLGGFSGGLDWKRRLLQREGSLPQE
jgi:methylated-DNA-[protein]-cysteine S-methyltransferase